MMMEAINIQRWHAGDDYTHVTRQGETGIHSRNADCVECDIDRFIDICQRAKLIKRSKWADHDWVTCGYTQPQELCDFVRDVEYHDAGFIERVRKEMRDNGFDDIYNLDDLDDLDIAILSHQAELLLIEAVRCEADHFSGDVTLKAGRSIDDMFDEYVARQAGTK